MGTDERKPRKTALDRWFEKPYEKRGTAAMCWIALALAISALWAYMRMDNDSYYMIVQGKEILESGIPEYNTFTYHGALTIVQQWLYCVGIYLADQVPGNWGLLAFMLAQALLLFALMERYIRAAHDDPFWSWLASFLVVILSSLNYFVSLRPENVTLILMLLQCMALDKYRDTGKKAWLLALPAAMLAEANLHASMWPIHLCVYAAYFVPPAWSAIQNKIREKKPGFPMVSPGLILNDGIGPDPWAYGAAIISVMAVLLNPYGFDNFTYIFRSMPVFSYVSIAEQNAPYLLSSDGVTTVLLIAGIGLLVKYRAIHATELCMAAGFLLMSAMRYHNSMFLVIGCACMARAAMRLLASKKPSRLADIVPNGAKAVVMAMLLVSAMAFAAMGLKIPEYKSNPGRDPAIEYIRANQSENGNVFNNLNVGPMLEYAGVRGLYGDTRPELLLSSIGGTQNNPVLDFVWMTTGAKAEELDRYEDIGDYLDQNHIQFVIDARSTPVMTYLAGWLESSDEWTMVTFKPAADAQKANAAKTEYCVWERME